MENKTRQLFEARLMRHYEELKRRYLELYGSETMFQSLCQELYRFFRERPAALAQRDTQREGEPDWYQSGKLLGMMLYIDNFGGNLQGVQQKLDYLQKANVNFLHLMPFLDTVAGRSDGGYAVADFRKVRPDLGTMEDLERFTVACHEKGIHVCMDFVMNHTSQDHEWAKRARRGEGEYMRRYFFYADPSVPAAYEKTVPQVFPTTAPGNFTWLEDCGYWVMTTFYPYQWDLNYSNPTVFNEMMYNFLYLANRGVDIFRIDAVPYIWKALGTSCRNLPQVHSIVRMMRMIGEIVCPSVILLGEVVMEPAKVAPYFGSEEQPECHMLYNVTTMATTWHTVATRDVRLLRKQLDTVAALPREYVFLNYLRCHDDIGWGLDYDTLRGFGMEEVPHKQYLNDFFRGLTGGPGRGRLYNEDPVTKDARFCATTASMCGLESARTPQKLQKAIRLDLMLHSFVLFQSGVPMLYSGDEIGQLNDNSYESDPNKAADSRYLHRGKMAWQLAAQADNPATAAGQLFAGLHQLEEIRARMRVFSSRADFWTWDTGSDRVLGLGRYYDGKKVLGLFNFGDEAASVLLPDGEAENLLTGERYRESATLPGGDFLWLEQFLPA